MKINGSTLQPGKYPVAIVLEDYETSKKTAKFHSVSVQFIIEVKGISPTSLDDVCSLIYLSHLLLGIYGLHFKSTRVKLVILLE